jgi:hypothetical protein
VFRIVKQGAEQGAAGVKSLGLPGEVPPECGLPREFREFLRNFLKIIVNGVLFSVAFAARQCIRVFCTVIHIAGGHLFRP